MIKKRGKMNEIQEQCKILASLVLFRELYDKEKDVYGVIAEFLNEIIAVNQKRNFNLTEITNLLNSTYDFSIPEAVINTAIRRLNLKKEKGFFIVDNFPKRQDNHLRLLQEKSISNNDSMLINLFSFIEAEKGEILSNNEKSKIISSFYSFLLDDSNGNEYSEFISGFMISHKNDNVFRNNLNKIREGLILYTGIKYSNLGEMGSWKTNLTIFLDTEILFHFAGYNGKLYKRLFDDFFNYVKEINNKAKKILIELNYFQEVKNEIESYFSRAEAIIEGKEQYNFVKSTAMASVIEDCFTKSDVLSKKTDFFHLLKTNLITESDLDLLSKEANYKYNIINEQLVDNFSNEFGFDISENIKFLNYINLHRKDIISNEFENTGSILLTGNSTTMKIALDSKIKQDGVVPLATTLNWITNRFWFKLNKGFGEGNFPLSFDIIAKAQMVLSSILDKSIISKYDELQSLYKKGDITKEQATARIVNLRTQTKKPEDIDSEDISSILDVLTEDSIEQFIKEQELVKIEAEKQKVENIKLKDKLHQKEAALNEEISNRTKAQNKLLKLKEEQLNDKKEELKRLEQDKNRFEKQAINNFNFFRIRIVTGLIILFLLFVVFSILINNEILDKISLIIPSIIFIVQIIYLFFFEKNWDWDIKKYIEMKKNNYKDISFAKNNFNPDILEKFQSEVIKLEKELSELRQEGL